jgi:hypothetical protein
VKQADYDGLRWGHGIEPLLHRDQVGITSNLEGKRQALFRWCHENFFHHGVRLYALHLADIIIASRESTQS